jgi:hypothetical protein
MPDLTIIILLGAAAVVLPMLLSLFVRPSVKCQVCGSHLPAGLVPKSLRQYLSGGRTCGDCGFDLDRWGQPVSDQPIPDKLAKRLNRCPDLTGLQAKPTHPGSEDVQRGGEVRD